MLCGVLPGLLGGAFSVQVIFAQPAFDGFDPNADANVHAMALQPDGRIIIGGSFHHLRPNRGATNIVHIRLARLNADGSVDTAFSPRFDGDVTVLALQPDGKMLIAGRFTRIWGTGAQNEADHARRNGFARLNTDGNVDLAFDPQPNGAVPVNPDSAYPYPQGELVRAIRVLPDGDILVGGIFRTFAPNGAASATPKPFLARLNADGTLDTAFDVRPNNVVLALDVQSDGRILVGGGFTTLASTGSSTALDRPRLARLSPDGIVDDTFVPRPNKRVLAILAQADDAFIVAGEFTSLEYEDLNFDDAEADLDEDDATRLFTARFLADGTLDTEFNPRANAPVTTIAIQTDGKVLFGGRFTSFQPDGGTTYSRSYVGRFHANGAIDEDFAPAPNHEVTAIAVQPDGNLLIGGSFTRVSGRGGLSVIRRRIARLLPDGQLDGPYTPQSGGAVYAVNHAGDGTVIVGGSFSSFAGITRNNLVRLDPGGVVDATFTPKIDNVVYVVARQSDGKILIGGAFATVNDVERPYLARLNADGSLDEAFNVKPNGAVSVIVIDSQARILIGGSFGTLTVNDAEEATTRPYLARILSSGTLDADFYPNPNSSVSALALQADDMILVGGSFTTFQPKAEGDTLVRYYLARIGPAGLVDADFEPVVNNSVSAIAIQTDETIVVGGSFTTVTPKGATEATERSGIARLKKGGGLDTAFDPRANGTVSRILIRPDGAIVIGGSFTTLQPNDPDDLNDPTNVNYFAWLNADGTLDFTRQFHFDSAVLSISASPLDADIFVGGGFTRLDWGDGSFARLDDHLVRIGADGSGVDAAYVPRVAGGAGGEITAIARHADGRLVYGGRFSDLAGSTNTNLTRVTAGGLPDSSFFSRVNGPVNTILVQPASDEDAVASGPFTWLDEDGLAFAAFNPTAAAELSGTVYTLLRASDGSVLVGGSFSYEPDTSYKNLLRFRADGSLDLSFNPAPDLGVVALAIDADGRILVGGLFKAIAGTDDSGVYDDGDDDETNDVEPTFDHLVRLNQDGTLDSTFDPLPNGSVYTIVPRSNGKYLVGGAFTAFTPNGAETSTSRAYFARLNEDGTVDSDLSLSVGGEVGTIVPLADDRILLGGSFTSVDSDSRGYIARLKSDFTLDTDFNASFDNSVAAIVVQDDGRILVGGSFYSFDITSDDDDEDNGEDAVVRPNLARLETNGRLDESFYPYPNSTVSALGLLSDGRIMVGGTFTVFYPGESNDPIVRNYVARLRADGVPDVGFNPIPDASVETLLVGDNNSVLLGGRFTELQPFPVLLVGGEFTEIGVGESAESLAHLAWIHADGSATPTKAPNPNNTVYALAALPDGGSLVAGAFTALAYDDATSDISRTSLARFDQEGNLDPAFAPTIDGPVRALALLPDGSFFIGGDFSSAGGEARQNLALLSADGVPDAGFAPTVDGQIDTLVVQPDGALVLTGSFSTVNGVARAHLARVNADGSLDATFAPTVNGRVSALSLQADGAMFIGGEFTQVNGVARARFARLTATGAVDAAIAAGADAPVSALNLQPDGSIVIAGSFGEFGGRARYLATRLNNATGLAQAIALANDRSTITWTNSGSRPEFAAVQFAFSADGETWTALGAPRQTAGGTWQLSGVNVLPTGNDLYFVRARATLAASRHLSTGRFETSWQFFGDTVVGPRFLANRAVSAAGADDGTDDSGGSDDLDGDDDGSDGSGGNDTGTGGSSITGPLAYHLVNFSVRAQPTDGTPIISGFIIKTAASQRVLVRAIGPSLGEFDVAGAMPAPSLRLYEQANGELLAESAAWGGDAALAQVFSDTGAFEVDPGSDDAALAPVLAPASDGYTMHVSPSDGRNGVVLSEIYYAGAGNEPGGLANVSARGPVGEGAAVLIGGFVVESDTPRRFLIRAAGPGLSDKAVSDAVADPMLRVYRHLNENEEIVAENDDWELQTVASVNALDLSNAAIAVGAFAFETGSADAAVVLTLTGGVYTVHVTSDTPGTTLIEVYELP